MKSPEIEPKATVNHNPFSESGTSPPVHPAAELFPMMDGKQLDELAGDIKKNGLQEPIWIHPITGEILDGRNRHRACQLAGIQPKYQTWDGSGSVLDFIVSKNIHRRHLDNHARTVIAGKLCPLFEAEAQVRQKSGKSSEVKGESTAKAAAAMNVSQRSVERAKKVSVKGSKALNGALETGAVSIAEAERLAKLPKEQQDELLKVETKKDRQKKLVESTKDQNSKTDDDRLNETVKDLRSEIKKLSKDLATINQDETNCIKHELKALRDVVIEKLKPVETLEAAILVSGGKK